MDLKQSFHRAGQQLKGKGIFKLIDQGAEQFDLVEKLYQKNGLEIKMTCMACPEQYEVFRNGTQVGYYRLRHGGFTVDYPDAGGDLIYEAYPDGDGCFEPYERLKYLTIALRELLKYLESIIEQ